MTPFRLPRPKSFLALVVLGLSSVALPLVLVLLRAGWDLGRLEKQGTGAVYRAVAATQGSRDLVGRALSLERRARQFVALRDEASYRAFEQEQGAFAAAVQALRESPLPEPQKDTLRRLSVRLETATAALQQGAAAGVGARAAVETFGEIHGLARDLLAGANALVVEEARSLSAATQKARSALAWQALAAAPLAFVFVVLFARAISQPMRQIGVAVTRLGNGDLETPVEVAGPADIEGLGGRIDWLRRRLSELHGERARLFARVSHDLKTPLTAIREGADLLLDRVVGPLTGDQEEVTRILRQNSLQLQKSIQTLVDLSVSQARPVSEQSEERVALEALAADVLADHGPAALKKDIRVECSAQAIFVAGDREQLRAVLDNLVSNAVKHTPAGGTVTVRAAQQGSRAVIDVQDTGPGIDPLERDQVFEPFYQGKARGAGAIRGSGLGLSIAREYVSRHRGTIEVVESSQGAHLRVTLPLIGGEEQS